MKILLPKECHLPGELPLASLGPAHNPGAAAALPTHTAARAGRGAGGLGWGEGCCGPLGGADVYRLPATAKPSVGSAPKGEFRTTPDPEPPGPVLRGRGHAACAGDL